MKNTEPENITLDQLANYRSQKGLTAKQVADEMHVSLPIVEHIESGAFEKIGAAPFIRGHVINYCKQVGLDAPLVINQIPNALLQHKDVQRPDAFLPASVSKVMLKTNHYGRYALGTSLLAVLLVSAYFVWDKWGLVTGSEPVLTTQGDQETVTYSSILPPVQKVETISDSTQQVQDESNTLEADLGNGNDSVQEELTDSSETPIDEMPQANEADDQLALNSATDTAIETINESNNDTEAQFVIEFDLQEQAWVSIKTENGDKVIHDLIGPGARRYESDQPMSMRIGNADKLTMTINGELVDLQPHTNKNLAKFEWPLEG